MKRWTKIGGMNEKSAFGLLSWFPDSENRTKLFYIGGLDQSYTARKSVELYDKDSDSWELYKSLPTDLGFRFPESPDYGCTGKEENIIYSVGLTKILALDWTTWQVSQVLCNPHKFMQSITLAYQRSLNGLK